MRWARLVWLARACSPGIPVGRCRFRNHLALVHGLPRTKTREATGGRRRARRELHRPAHARGGRARAGPFRYRARALGRHPAGWRWEHDRAAALGGRDFRAGEPPRRLHRPPRALSTSQRVAFCAPDRSSGATAGRGRSMLRAEADRRATGAADLESRASGRTCSVTCSTCRSTTSPRASERRSGGACAPLTRPGWRLGPRRHPCSTVRGRAAVSWVEGRDQLLSRRAARALVVCPAARPPPPLSGRPQKPPQRVGEAVSRRHCAGGAQGGNAPWQARPPGRLRCQCDPREASAGAAATPLGQAADVAGALRQTLAVDRVQTSDRVAKGRGAGRAKRLCPSARSWESRARCPRGTAPQSPLRAGDASPGARDVRDRAGHGAQSASRRTASVSVSRDARGHRKLAADKLPSDVKSATGQLAVSFQDVAEGCRTAGKRPQAGYRHGQARRGAASRRSRWTLRGTSDDLTRDERRRRQVATIDDSRSRRVPRANTGIRRRQYRGRRPRTGSPRRAISTRRRGRGLTSATRPQNTEDGGRLRPKGAWNFSAARCAGNEAPSQRQRECSQGRRGPENSTLAARVYRKCVDPGTSASAVQRSLP